MRREPGNEVVDMALFLSADFHQGSEILNVHSIVKQCAFMTVGASYSPQYSIILVVEGNI